MPRAFIHAGFHKTGTTAFQHFLRDHREWLLAHGIYVPRSGQDPGGAYHAVARTMAGLPGPASFQPLPGRLAAELREEAESRDILISTESLSAMLRAPLLRDRVFGFFSDLGYRPTVILYLRHPPEALNSAYSQVTKSLDLIVSFETFASMQLEGERPRAAFLHSLASEPGITAIVRPYNDRVRRAGIIASVLGEIGIEAPDLPLPRANEAPGPIAVHLARYIGQVAQASGEPLTPGRRRALAAAVRGLAGDEPVAYCGLTDELVERIETSNADLRDELALTLWGRSWSESFPGEMGQRYRANDIGMVPPAAAEADRLKELEAQLRGAWERITADASIAVPPPWPTRIPNAMQALGIDAEALGLYPRP